jgi:hypothetical protein
MRLNRKTRVPKITQVVMAFGAATALLLGLSGPASALDDGTGSYRVYITNIRFSFPSISDCDLICSSEAELYSSKIGAWTQSIDEPGYDYINMGVPWRENAVDVSPGNIYYPSRWGRVSANGWTNNTLSFRANSTSKVEVGFNFLDADSHSNDDLICSNWDYPAVYTNLATWSGPRNVTHTSLLNSNGQCKVSYTINVV